MQALMQYNMAWVITIQQHKHLLTFLKSNMLLTPNCTLIKDFHKSLSRIDTYLTDKIMLSTNNDKNMANLEHNIKYLLFCQRRKRKIFFFFFRYEVLQIKTTWRKKVAYLVQKYVSSSWNWFCFLPWVNWWGPGYWAWCHCNSSWCHWRPSHGSSSACWSDCSSAPQFRGSRFSSSVQAPLVRSSSSSHTLPQFLGWENRGK